MDSNQFNYPNQNQKSIFGLYLVVFFFCILSAAVLYFLLYTLTGKQLINEFFPTVERTNSLLEELNPSIEIYNFNQTNKVTNASTSGFFSEDMQILYVESSFNITKMVASSSAASQPIVKRKLFYENGTWYISDIFNDKFSILKNSYISEQFVNTILPEPNNRKSVV